jgi:hypothetical protein
MIIFLFPYHFTIKKLNCAESVSELLVTNIGRKNLLAFFMKLNIHENSIQIIVQDLNLFHFRILLNTN